MTTHHVTNVAWLIEVKNNWKYVFPESKTLILIQMWFQSQNFIELHPIYSKEIIYSPLKLFKYKMKGKHFS